MSKILVPVASGFEEIEAVSIIDVCRRAGIEVIVAGVDKQNPKGANGITIETDIMLDPLQAMNYDMIVLPGGMGGTTILCESPKVQALLKEFKASQKFVGAICAAPLALHAAGVLSQNYTCYPTIEQNIRLEGHTSEQKVVTDGKVMTSRGPGTAICFGLEIIKTLEGEETYQSVKEGLLADFC